MRRHIGYHDFYSTIIGSPFICHCEPLPIVIASGAWQSQRGTGLLSLFRAEALSDVKSQARNLAWRLLRHPSLRVGFLAMTEGGHCEPFTSCHSERSEESQEAQDRLRVAISGNSNGKNAK